MRIPRWIGMLGVALAASSCSLDVPDDGVSLAVYIAVDRGTLGLNETVTVTVTARNVGFEPLTLTAPSDCLLYIDVYDSQDSRIFNSASNCTGSSVTQEIAAGADFVRTFEWDGSGSGGARVPSGLYRIRPVAQLTGRPGLAGPSATVAVEGG